MNEALLAALEENPDDLTTWDVLADWLEERGDPRAEFMRLTRDVEYPNASLPIDQQKRLRDAQARAQRAWFGDQDLTSEQGLVWRHGFVSSAFIDRRGTEHTNSPAFRFAEELSFRNASLAQLQTRPLRALRASGTPTGTLTLTASTRLLVLLHSVRAEPPAFIGPAPETLIVDEPWLEAISDQRWLAEVAQLRVHLTTEQGVERFAAWVHQLKDFTYLSNERERRRRTQRLRSWFQRVRLLVSPQANAAMSRCEAFVRNLTCGWRAEDFQFTWLSQRAETTPSPSLTSFRAQPARADGLPGTPCDDAPWLHCAACASTHVRRLSCVPSSGAGTTPDLAVEVWCPACGCFSTLRYRESGLPWWRYGYEYDDD